MPGLEAAEVLRHGYAVEYDVVAPRQVGATLETNVLPGLYLAGQLLGTSGYEEAAALGLVAGINAVKALRGGDAFVPRREDSYIGVLDDIWGREHREPYRMFTSRAEHRLLLGVDSARERLMEEGTALVVFRRKRFTWNKTVGVTAPRRSSADRIAPQSGRGNAARVRDVAGIELTTPTTWANIETPGCRCRAGGAVSDGSSGLTASDRRVVVGLLRYDGYLARHERERARVRRLRDIEIPEHLDPHRVSGLSRRGGRNAGARAAADTRGSRAAAGDDARRSGHHCRVVGVPSGAGR